MLAAKVKRIQNIMFPLLGSHLLHHLLAHFPIFGVKNTRLKWYSRPQTLCLRLFDGDSAPKTSKKVTIHSKCGIDQDLLQRTEAWWQDNWYADIGSVHLLGSLEGIGLAPVFLKTRNSIEESRNVWSMPSSKRRGEMRWFETEDSHLSSKQPVCSCHLFG